MPEWITKIFTADFMSAITPKIIGAVVITIFFVVVYKIFAGVLRRALAKTGLALSLRKILVHSVFKWTIIIFAGISLLGQFGVDVTAALAGVGIAGIAIGFAAKESLSSILAGLSIFIEELYVTGDWVEIAGKHGQVKEITLRTTKIRTLDNIFIIVPNSEVIQNPVTNFSEEGMVRITVSIGISYDTPIDHARDVLLSALQGQDQILAEPAPAVVVNEMGDSAVELWVRVWVDDAGADATTQFALNELCKKALDQAGIEIPFPQRVVHMVQKSQS